MRLVVFFAPNFCEWPVGIIRQMMEKDPGLEVIGLAFDRKIHDRVRAQEGLPLTALYDLDELEKKWIGASVSNEDFKKLEDVLGPETLSKTVMADKNLATGWVDGAIIYDTPLAAMARDSERLKAYVYGFYTFLLDLYKRHDPDLAFIYTIASGATYAVGAAALHHGFPFLRFQHSRIQKFFVLDTTLDGMLEPVQRALEQAGRDEGVLAEFLEPARQHLAACRLQALDTSNLALNKKMYTKAMQWPVMLRKLAGIAWRSCKKALKPNGMALRERPERQNFVFKVSSAFTRRYLNADKYARPFSTCKDKPYVYFPLHVDPEASTLICAPYHANQTAVIEALSKSIPLSACLLVKEHPIMIGKRPRGFYKKIAGMPNVVLVPHDESSHDLIKNASLVATITGTAGWEALVMEKPLLLLGRTPYMQVGQGIVFCQDYAALPRSVLNALETKPAGDEALIRYIAAVMKEGVHVPDELLWNYSPAISEKYSGVTQAIADYLLSYADRIRNPAAVLAPSAARK